MNSRLRTILAIGSLLLVQWKATWAADGNGEEGAVRALRQMGVVVRREHSDRESPVVGIEVFLSPHDAVSVKDFEPVGNLESLRTVRLTGSRIDDSYAELFSRMKNLNTIELAGRESLRAARGKLILRG